MVINDYGPVIKQWSMRYEAFHSYFKKLAVRLNNFKNLPKLLATRYRLKQAFKLSNMMHFKNVDHAVTIKKIKSNFLNNSMKRAIIDHFGNIDLTKDLVQCNKLYHNNVEYRRSYVYIMD